MIAGRSINAGHTGAVNFVFFCFCRVEAVFHFLEPLVWTCLMMNPRLWFSYTAGCVWKINTGNV